MAVNSNTTLAARPVKEVYAVSRLVREARGVLEGSFPLLWVEGEISNLAMPASGHIYFTLKDEAAQVRCAMFRNRNRQLRFVPENGIQVLLRVRVTLYEGRGEFQLVVEHMEEAGSGALQRAYEALKHRLGEEGLFDQATKKELPSMPKSIGIVSSPDGAAVHDILTVLNRRFPAANVILYPVAVQGNDSAKQIAQAIALADQRQECDLLIIGRGGGSLEDLWSFNEEQVARAIFACELPIISAVGHEVDFTIADFVADVRAATPSAAAEIAVPDTADWLSKINSYRQRLSELLTDYLKNERRNFNYLQQRLLSPQTKIEQQTQRLDNLQQQFQRSYLQLIKTKRQRLDYWSVRLKHPQAKIETQHYKVASFHDRLQQIIQHKMEHYRANLGQQIRTLAAVSPLNTLERGYSITTAIVSGDVLRNVDNIELGQHINVRLQQGQLRCEVKEVKND
ncbi:MAG: exodeoxyribonuclease VII large subunit [Piscirickettsiaceae bacterium]|nr:exodeoxyribonuclease VII large subunit [Piscirickettsiaceae bacterium]